MIKILDSAAVPINEILQRENAVSGVSDAVCNILREVRERGDNAVREFTARFDRTQLDSFELTEEEYAAGAAAADPQLVAVMKKAAANIREYHSAQVRQSTVVKDRDGVVLGQRVMGLARVLLYVPGGTARYPSSVLMNAIPASLAGVGEIIMTTPPSADGTVPPAILAAASITGFTVPSLLGGVVMTICEHPAIFAGMLSMSTVEG